MRDIWARNKEFNKMTKLLGFKSESNSCQQGMGSGKQLDCTQCISPRPVTWTYCNTDLLFWGAIYSQSPASPASQGGFASFWAEPFFPGLFLLPLLECAKKEENHWQAKTCFNLVSNKTVQCAVAGPSTTPIKDATPTWQLSEGWVTWACVFTSGVGRWLCLSRPLHLLLPFFLGFEWETWRS